MDSQDKKKVLVMIPTYNEAENIRELIAEILALSPRFDISVLVVDDDSPDGTGRLVEDLARNDGRIRLLLRKKRRGRGTAGSDGFREALGLNPDFIIEMDGDFSHEPRYIPDLLAAAENHDLALGSRFIAGGRDAERNFVRRLITLFVRKFIRRLFRLPVGDVSSGFRCFRKEALEKIGPDDLISTGPSIVLEVLYKASLLGFRIGEIPIRFRERRKGKTKLTLLTLAETLVMALKFKKIYSDLSRKARS